MKILILWSGAVVPSYRQFFLELSRHLRVRVLSPRRWTHGSKSFEAEAETGADAGAPACEIIPVAYLPQGSSRYFVPSLPFHLWGFRPRYLYVMDEMDRPSLAWHALVARLAWPPVRVISYSLQNLSAPGYRRWHHRLAAWMNRRLVSRCIAASREADGIVKADGFAKPTRVIPLWGSEAVFFPGTAESAKGYRSDLGIGCDERVILYAGSMAEAKGLRLLAEVLPRFPRLRVLSAGNGPLASGLGGTSGGRWIHLGALEGSDLRRFYQSGDYIILPSITMPHWKEQIGRSLIEGILCGCIALGSDSGYIPELTLFPEAAFRQGDPESLAALLAALPLAGEADMRAAQLRNVRERFTAVAVARETWSFLREENP